MKIALGSDHAGFEMKQKIKAMLHQLNHDPIDFGTDSADSMDYPDIAHPVALSVESGNAEMGILICGSANGVAITANKHPGIRAAICWQRDLAALARNHNNANILCIPARFVHPEEASEIVKTFLTSEFEGGRHEQRVRKISC